MNMMRAAEKWLKSQHSQFLSETVLYRHFGEDGTVETEIQAVRGRTLFRAENEYGVTVRVTSADFIVSALEFEPLKGDEIICSGRMFYPSLISFSMVLMKSMFSAATGYRALMVL